MHVSEIDPSGVEAHGFAAPGYERVAAEFVRNLKHRADVGASFAAVREGSMIVDLWGGLADRDARIPWRADTLQLIFSGSKGLVAVCLLILVDRGELDPEKPVSTYWPEFAAAGKGGVTVSEVASHCAGLPGIRSPLAADDLADDVHMAALLAAQPLETDPRARDAYHPLTYGWLCGELIRRIDGRSVGRFFAEEVAAPLELEVWIGLPESLESRVSTLCYAPDWGMSMPDAKALADDALLASVWSNPPLFPPDGMCWNTRRIHAAEVPGVGAIGTARSIARLYACLANRGELDGVRLMSAAVIQRGRECLTRRRDALTDQLSAFGLGFELQTEDRTLGPPDEAFGFVGAGGSTHGAWPGQSVGFSYCMNELRDNSPADARAAALLAALHECLR